MRRAAAAALLALALAAPARRVRASEPAQSGAIARAGDDGDRPAAVVADEFGFFSREANVALSASRRPEPSPLVRAPATVYVLTAEDIRASGAQTIPDALRAVPGVDVLSIRTAHQEVGIRGLNTNANRRVLVLVDGRSVLNSFYDYISWTGLPVVLEQIDRIEVVEGPLSSAYGANAVSGVINIITKKPEQLGGAELGYVGGERKFHRPFGVAGGKSGRIGYAAAGSWLAQNSFDEADVKANRTGSGNAAVTYDPGRDQQIGLSAGGSRRYFLRGNVGYEDGSQGFLRGDYRWRRTRLRAFWNQGDFAITSSALPIELRYNAYDVNLDQALSLPFNQEIAVGAGYRRNDARSTLLPPGKIEQDLWSFFVEDTWSPLPRWSFVAAGRLDRHPFTRWQFSPRASAIFVLSERQSFRLSGGTAFRNPTIFENYADITVSTPGSPPFTTVVTDVSPNTDVKAETMAYGELAHRGIFNRFKTSVALFQYDLKDLVAARTTSVSSPPTLTNNVMVSNAGKIRAWGGEAGLDLILSQGVTAFLNYSFQELREELETTRLARNAPKHKANAGLRYRHAGFLGNLWVHWVDETFFAVNSTTPIRYQELDDYALLNVGLSYAFKRWEGLSLGVQGFNVAKDRHYESPPPAGERIGSRWTGSLSYTF